MLLCEPKGGINRSAGCLKRARLPWGRTASSCTRPWMAAAVKSPLLRACVSPFWTTALAQPRNCSRSLMAGPRTQVYLLFLSHRTQQCHWRNGWIHSVVVRSRTPPPAVCAWNRRSRPTGFTPSVQCTRQHQLQQAPNLAPQYTPYGRIIKLMQQRHA